MRVSGIGVKGKSAVCRQEQICRWHSYETAFGHFLLYDVVSYNVEGEISVDMVRRFLYNMA